MFRSDRDALAQQVEEMRQEQAQLRAENDAMRSDLLARRQQAPEPRGGTGLRGDVYRTGISHLTPGERAALAHHEVEAFPVWASLLLHYLTFGLFSIVHVSTLHGRLPQAEADDPSAAKAMGFWLIPYFNAYWMLFSTLRLADRLNLQLRLRGLPSAVPRNLVLASAVITLVPGPGWALGIFLLWPLAIAYLQSAANTLAALAHDGSDAAAGQRVAAPGVRIQEPQRLPVPDDVIEQQAELEAEPLPGARNVMR